MEYLIGVVLALGVAAFATADGFDRERSFYPTVMIVIASYYILFAVMGASRNTLIVEILVACVFSVVAVLGYRISAWFLAAALVGHGVFDLVHHLVIDNPGVPPWWPGFCGAFDALFGAVLAVQLIRHPERVSARL
jgi:uncharacterized membrane protein HdeD (DUF308 family)